MAVDPKTGYDRNAIYEKIADAASELEDAASRLMDMRTAFDHAAIDLSNAEARYATAVADMQKLIDGN